MDKNDLMEKIWNHFKKLIIYLVIIAITYYIAPLIIGDTGSAILMLIIITPVICFLTSILYGINNGFSLALPILVGLLFLPIHFIYYNNAGEGSEIYIFIYTGISLFSNIIGAVFKNRRRR